MTLTWSEGDSPSALNDRLRAVMLDEAVRYSSSVTVRCQPEMTAAVAKAAKARGTRPAEYIRQALRSALQLDGFDPATIPPRDAGTLYDSIEGKQRYALVTDAGAILAMGYHDAKPEETEGRGRWLPVVHLDSEPFDLATMWRQAPPVTHIEADRVVVTFPVIPKSLEAM